MKIRNFFLAGLAAVALSACSDDQPVDNGPASGLKGYITLDITAPQTKTDGTGQTPETGDPGESNITSVTIVLTNATGAVEEAVTVGLDATAAPTLKTVAAQVTPGAHYVYALVNYAGTTAALAGNLITKVIDVAAADDAITGYKDGSFLMVNEYNGAAGAPAGGVLATITTAHNSAATALNVPVKVDRVAVKVKDATTTPTITDLTASTSLITGVDVIGFVPLNINKQFNLVQKWNAVGSDQVLSTPLFVADGSANISSQYWFNIGEYTELGKTGTTIESITDKTVAADYAKGPIYMTENRPKYTQLSTNEYTAGKGETSAVIYRVQAKGPSGNTPTFYKFLNIITTNLSDIQSQPTFDGNTIVQSATGVPADFPKLRANGIQVYEDGVMYYTYFIKDVNTNHQLGGKNYYGVFRNSVYSLTVNSIKKIGDDVPGGSVNPVDPDPTVPTDPTDPTDPTNPPIDEEEAYITVTVAINPWILNTIGIDF